MHFIGGNIYCATTDPILCSYRGVGDKLNGADNYCIILLTRIPDINETFIYSMNASATKITLADENAVLREGLSLSLEQNSFFITAKVGSFSGLKAALKNHDIDVIICDCLLTGEGPINLLHHVHRNHPHVKILFLTSIESGFLFQQLLAMGVNGLVSKKSDFTEIILAIDTINSGTRYISPTIAHEMDNAPNKLTAKEFQMLELVVQGKSNAEIATALHKATGTINIHRVSIMHKLDVHTVVDLVHFCHKNGLFIS